MESIILIGGGGHCESCIDVIEQQGKYQIAGIVDIKEKMGQKVAGYEIFAYDKNIPMLAKKFTNFFITIGQIVSAKKRSQIFSMLKMLNVHLPIIISPFAYVSSKAVIKKGTIIHHHALVNTGSVIGENCVINSKALIEHGVKIGNHCHVSTGTIVNGDVSLGNCSFIGSNATVRHGVSIGDNCTIGAGIKIMKSVKQDSLIQNDFY